MPIQTDPSTARRRDRANHGQAGINVMELSCGEIAVALQIAGLPARWRRMPTRGLIDLALAGIATIGLDEVLRINAESRRVRNAGTAGESPHERAALERIWPSTRSRQAATDAAWTIFHPHKHRITRRITGLLRITH